MFPRRFFKIQFDHGTIEIYKSLKVDDQDINRIRFSEVVTVSTPTERLQQELVEKCSKKFQWPFFLYTEKRNFELYAQTEQERKMWIAAFDYIIRCGWAIKKIIREREAQRKNKDAIEINILNKSYKASSKEVSDSVKRNEKNETNLS